MKKTTLALCLFILFSLIACGCSSGSGFAGVAHSDALKTFGTPLSPTLAERGTPCYFNGSNYPYSHFKWAEYDDGSGKYCLMVLIDTEVLDRGAIDALSLPWCGTPAIRRNGRNIYMAWTDPTDPEEDIELMFEEHSRQMVVIGNPLKGVKRRPNQSETVAMPVSVHKNDSGYDRYYIPLYAILNEIGGGVVFNAFNMGEAYIFSGADLQSYAGFWETSDRDDYRADAVIDGKTRSIASNWKGLELRPNGMFTLSSRIYHEGNWVLIEESGRYVFWGRMLVMLYETVSEWRGADYAALAPVRVEEPAGPYVSHEYVEDWDADYLGTKGHQLYANMTERGDAAPRPGKAQQIR